jgi:hypothetical protein
MYAIQSTVMYFVAGKCVTVLLLLGTVVSECDKNYCSLSVLHPAF